MSVTSDAPCRLFFPLIGGVPTASTPLLMAFREGKSSDVLPDTTMSSTFPDEPPSRIQASACIHVAEGCVRSE